jgi:integrase/recombinase XerD
MSELRTRMIRDMALRGFSPRTHESYVAAVVRLARYYHRSPDQLTNEEVHAYLAHLIQERKLSWSTCAQAAHACRFLYHVTLGRPPAHFSVPAPKQPQKLPDILSRQEVWRLLRACAHPWHRLLLATTYAGGLRVSELVALKVADLDADRMTIPIVQGKGGQDRYVPLSQRLWQDIRGYWPSARPASGSSPIARVRAPSISPSPRRSTRRPNCGPASRSKAVSMPSATRSRPICSKAAGICRGSSSSSATAISPPPRAIST